MNIWLLPRTNQFFKLKPLWRGNGATHKLQTISWIIWILDMNKTAEYKMILHWCFKWTKWNTGLTDWFEKRYEEKGDPEHYGGCSDQVSSTVESKTESLTGTWLAWKCAVLVFNWSRHIWVLESSQSLCICLFWLFFVSDNCILNPSSHQPHLWDGLETYLDLRNLCPCHGVSLCRPLFFGEVWGCGQEQTERCSLVHLRFLLFYWQLNVDVARNCTP